jgi:hypothetical protein
MLRLTIGGLAVAENCGLKAECSASLQYGYAIYCHFSNPFINVVYSAYTPSSNVFGYLKLIIL